MSGISANEQLLAEFGEAKNGKIRIICMRIENEQINLYKSIDTHKSWECDFDKYMLPLLENSIACYILYRLDSKNSLGYEWILFTWIPDEANVRQKTLYAATRSTLRRQFGDGSLADDLLCHTKVDITLSAYQKYLLSKAAPAPLTFTETENKLLQEENVNHCSLSESSRSFGGISFSLDSSAASIITEFSKGNGVYIQMQIDVDAESIVVSQFSNNLEPEGIAPMTSVNSGSYHLYRFVHEYLGMPFSSIFFIHAIAGYQSSIKERMLYSSCKATLLHRLLNEFKIKIEHKLEIDNFKDVTGNFLTEIAHPQTTETSLLVVKPKGPGGRGPRRLIK